MEEGHLFATEQLLSLGVDPNIRDSFGLTPVHLASLKGHVDLARILIQDWGAFASPSDQEGSTPLHKAAFRGDVTMIRILLDLGADLHAKDVHGWSALMESSYNGEWECVTELVERERSEEQRRERREREESEKEKREGREGREREEGVCEEGVEKREEMENECMQMCDRCDTMSRRGWEERDLSGNSALHLASQNGSVSCVTRFLNLGCDPNQRGSNGRTPLHFAAMYHHKEVVTVLLQGGSDVFAEDDDQKVPFDLVSVNVSGDSEVKMGGRERE